MDIPAIILTARNSVADRAARFEGGADNYVPRSFSFEELLARVRPHLYEETPTSSAITLTRGPLVLDLKTRRARMDEE